MSAGKASTSETSTNGPIDLAEQATEGLLGPNPFVGLSVEDIVTSFRAIGEQAMLNPTLVVEQEAALIRELVAVMAGRSELAPPKGDKRFGDQAWQENPLYRMMLQGYVAWTTRSRGSSIVPHSTSGPRIGRASPSR
jgi:polyhydroxyalkanoate synthase subunit PhaC